MKVRLSTLYTLLFILSITFITPLEAQEVHSKNGMVVSASLTASEAGAAILKKGGNAIDASIATAFALAVTHPSAGNIGGGGFLVYMDSTGNSTTIDFREKAPLKASATMFLDEESNLIPNSNHYSAKAVGVPGTVAGLYLAHQKYGKLPWSELVQPAIDLAKNGIALNYDLYRAAQYFDKNAERLPHITGFFKDENGEPLNFYDTWKQPELAETLELIRDKGRDGFYKGKVAKEIETFMKENDGLITRKDLSKYEAVERKPLKTTYRAYEVHTMPPPSSGGVAMIEMLNIMELVNFDTVEFNSAGYVHLMAEAMRRAYSDRAAYLGDPDFNPGMPLDQLLSKDHAQQLLSGIDWNKATKSDSSKFGNLPEGDNTTHFSVMDKDGNAVSVTYTLEYAYGSAIVAPSLGFVFNNEMGDFNPVPGETTNKGRIGTKANLIAPEKRMLSSMSPAIVSKDGKPYLVVGSPGGRTIINTVFQTILNVVEFEMPIDQAIEAMKIHHQWLPDRILYEKHLLSPDTRNILEAMGHNLESRRYLGRLMGIIYKADEGLFIGAADSSSLNGGVAKPE